MTNMTLLAGEEFLEAFRGPKLTVADYRRSPEGPPWYELIDGVLLAEPSPNSSHQEMMLELVGAMSAWFIRDRRGKLYFAPLDVYLSNHDVLQPDILYISERRKAIVGEEGILGAPDLVVEVLSPSNARFTRTKKCATYARFGVQEFWLVDPESASIEVFQFARHRTLPMKRLGVRDVLVSPLLPGFELPVVGLFSGPPS